MRKLFGVGGRLALVLSALVFTHCAGKAAEQTSASAAGSSSDAGNTGSGGTAGSDAVAGGAGAAQAGSAGHSTCDGAKSTPVGRPTAIECTPSASLGTPSFDAPDAGSVNCSKDTDCTALDAYTTCLRGQCSADECLGDEDCANGQICMCWTDQRGNAQHRNRCLTVTCRTDADCGPGGACSPSYGSFCGSLDGYYCHSAADTCNSNSDCCGSTPTCQYQPTLGHFACTAATACNG